MKSEISKIMYYNYSLKKSEEEESFSKTIPPLVYACATMWHESHLEMVQLLKSILR